MQARIILPQMQNYLRARAVPDAGSFAVKTFFGISLKKMGKSGENFLILLIIKGFQHDIKVC